MTFVLDILCTLFFSLVKLGVVPNLSSSCENLIIMVALMLCILTFKATKCCFTLALRDQHTKHLCSGLSNDTVDHSGC